MAWKIAEELGGVIMIEVITATFEDGVLKPNGRLNLPPHSRVRLVVQPLDEEADETRRQAWEAAERLWQQSALDSQGARLSREQLHERR
jgi:predicted DNA-binding antitoxin AbrB/MazE fold protein